ncbi:class I SAM-dependent methyltransferase [Nocardia sp. BMG51109]|uniref:class I SAM-dependent methyltransferase n=1 Tax=Nocardia sp. BMG51109 TaxID=1056816 RepID=UPI0004670213|nr:class I SAM-dependent methyltransferase [Nocardia sp. BMG51109]
MRTEGDTWDIVSSVGATALGVASFRAIETELPDAMIRDHCARLFVQSAGDPQFVDIIDNPPEIGSLPRVIGLRTRFFDEFFDLAAAAGIRQAVIVAAGLDARSYRLDWPVGTTVFEIDQPKVLEFKQRVLAEHEVEPTAGLRSVAVDLRDDWPAALAGAGFDPDLPTAWSAEGLLPYLPGPAQVALFERIDTLSAPGSRFSVEGFPIAPPDIARFQDIIRNQFDRNPFGDIDVTELFYDDERPDPTRWLTDRGWSVDGYSVVDLAGRYDQAIPELPGDVADMSESRAYLSARK